MSENSLDELRKNIAELIRDQRFETVERKLRRLLEQAPDDAWGWNNLGATVDKLGRTDEAIKIYRHTADLAPANLAVHFNLGQALIRKGELTAAIDAFAAASKLNSANINVLENLALALIKADRNSEALPALERCIALRPDNIETLYLAGRTARSSKQDALATAYFERILNLDNTHLGALFQLGELNLWYGNPTQSQRYSSLAIQQLLRAPRPTAKAISSPKLDIDAAGVALNDLVVCLEANGIEPFLNGGTLLGCIRDDALIEHDKDIDIGVLPGADAERIREAIDAHPDLEFDWKDNWQGEALRYRVTHRNGIGGDIFFYREDGDAFYCGVPRGNYLVLWRDSRFDLKRIRFLGREFLIPDDPERYLTENYGDWKKPDPWHVAALNSPNLIGGYNEIQRATGLLSIAQSLFKGEWEKARYYSDFVLERDDNPLVDQVRSTLPSD